MSEAGQRVYRVRDPRGRFLRVRRAGKRRWYDWTDAEHEAGVWTRHRFVRSLARRVGGAVESCVVTPA